MKGNIIIISCNIGMLLLFFYAYLIFVLRGLLILLLLILFFMMFLVSYFLVIYLIDFIVLIRLRKYHFHCIFYFFTLKFIHLYQLLCCPYYSFFDQFFPFFFIFTSSHSFLLLDSVIRQLFWVHYVISQILLMILSFLITDFRSVI